MLTAKMLHQYYLFILMLVGTTVASDHPPFTANLTRLIFTKQQEFASTNGYVNHMEMDLYMNDSSILFSDLSSLENAAINGSTTSIISSGFSVIGSFKQLNSTHVIVSDIHGSCLKIVDRVQSVVNQFAGQCGSPGRVDGFPGKFEGPKGLELDKLNPGKLLVTENSTLRSVDLTTGELSTVIASGFDSPEAMAWYDDHLLVVNSGFISEVMWTGKTVTNTRVSLKEFSGGKLRNASFQHLNEISQIEGPLFLLADETNKQMHLVDMQRKIVLPVCTTDTESCAISTQIWNPESILKTDDAIYLGTHQVIYEFSGGLDFNSSKFQCPTKTISMQLPEGEKMATVNLDDDKVLKAGQGFYEYLDVNSSCTTQISIGEFIPEANCSQKLTVLSSADTKMVTVSIPITGGYFEIDLPAGEFNYRTIIGDKTCNASINVSGPEVGNSLRRRLVFQAKYDMACDVFRDFTKYKRIKAVAQYHFGQVVKICGLFCRPISSPQILISCDDDKTTIQWPTNLMYDRKVMKLGKRLKSALQKSIDDVFKRTTGAFSLMGASLDSPLIAPNVGEGGKRLTMRLIPFCMNKLQYNPKTQNCQ